MYNIFRLYYTVYWVFADTGFIKATQLKEFQETISKPNSYFTNYTNKNNEILLFSQKGNLINHTEENVRNYTNKNADFLLTFEEEKLLNHPEQNQRDYLNNNAGVLFTGEEGNLINHPEENV